MFNFFFNESNVVSYDLLLIDFDDFLKEEGFLPPLLVHFFYNDDVPKNELSKEYSVGKYIFYKKTQSGYWISSSDAYIFLSLKKNTAKVFFSKIKLKAKIGELDLINKKNLSYLLMQAYMYTLISAGGMMIHAAAVVCNNVGILFCGASGAGKSTQANLWEKFLNAKPLNYDKPCIIENDGKIYVHGSPWSGKEDLFINGYVPIKAIVFVNKSSENKVERMSNANAFSHIYLHNYVYPFDKEIEDDYSNVVKKIANAVPVYNLYCGICEEAVQVLYNSLFHNGYKAKGREINNDEIQSKQ